MDGDGACESFKGITAKILIHILWGSEANNRHEADLKDK